MRLICQNRVGGGQKLCMVSRIKGLAADNAWAHLYEAINYRPLADLQIACEWGAAFVDLPSTLVWFDSFGRHQESLDSERPAGEQLLIRFHQAVLHGGHPLLDWQEVRRNREVLCGAAKSHAEGRRWELPMKEC